MAMIHGEIPQKFVILPKFMIRGKVISQVLERPNIASSAPKFGLDKA